VEVEREARKTMDAIEALLSEELDPLFWRPARMGQPSAWWTHVPFAFWVIQACSPRLFVELGTHAGVSYSAFCEAVINAKTGTRCYAIDTWKGDAHAGFYDESVYWDFRDHNERRYGAFSELMRSTFDDAAHNFADKSIDLLHIDGLHTYEAVRHDFETWLPKLSNSAVVLFHDTNVFDDDFGVHRLFKELSAAHPHFEFLHGHGLGLVVIGPDAPETIMALCAIDAPRAAQTIRDRFSTLGAGWFAAARELIGSAGFRSQISALQGHAEKAAAERDTIVAALDKERQALLAQVGQLGEEINSLHQDVSAAREKNSFLEQTYGKARLESDDLHRRLIESDERFSSLDAAYHQAQKNIIDLEERITSALKQISLGEDVSAQAHHKIQELQSRLNVALEQRSYFETQASRSAASTQLSEEKRRKAVKRLKDVRAESERASEQNLLLKANYSALEKKYAALVSRPRKPHGPSTWALLAKRALRKDWRALENLNLISNSLYFDRDWYLNSYPDVMAARIDPALHYLIHGYRENRDPGPSFSSSEYLNLHADVKAAGMNPLLHYLRHGQAENRPIRSVSEPPPAPGLAEDEDIQILDCFFVSGEPETPGHIYRVVRQMDALNANGLTTDWLRADGLAARRGKLPDAKVAVFWRVAWTPDVGVAIDELRASGCKIVFDVDDLMIEPSLATTDVIDGIRSQGMLADHVKEHFDRVQKTMFAADYCITTTEELALHMRRLGKVTFVSSNSFDASTHALSRQTSRLWRDRDDDDGLIRIGYAGGSKTHQKDFAVAAEAIAQVLRSRANCRLVLFFRSGDRAPVLDPAEFPALAALDAQIEWRELRPLVELPAEMARFDINLAPLETGNPFCEAKSELKYFEAALVDCPTVASPTGPFRRAIQHGKTGYLAARPEDWLLYLQRLVDDESLRRRMGRSAYRAALGVFGPASKSVGLGAIFEQIKGGPAAARAFAFSATLSDGAKAPTVFATEVIYQHDKFDRALVTVIIPLYNYAHFLLETLESVRQQSLECLDLVIVDDQSTDNSLEVANDWIRKHKDRFNRVVLIRNCANYGLANCRNSGFDAADTPYVLPLDADNKLTPDACEKLLASIQSSRAAFVYPTIQRFGPDTRLMGCAPFDPQRLAAGNYIDAMALVSKEAWAIVGGYEHVPHGWEDYDLWCRLAERGLRGEWRPDLLAFYRVHPHSMLATQTTVADNYRQLTHDFSRRHPWVSLMDRELFRKPIVAPTRLGERASRLDKLLPLLRCPETGQKLTYEGAGGGLSTVDGLRQWPVLHGRPILSAALAEPDVKSDLHLSNGLSEGANELIRNTSGWVLNLSAGGSEFKPDHVVEVEFAVFRNTDVVADAQSLPFDDAVFDAAVVMNAFEHYREPNLVAAELRRVLKPGGRLLVHTAFLQPLHEAPWHYFNCTRYGLEEWFKDFDLEVLRVSPNFCPNHTIGWLTAEAEAALRRDVSDTAADAFREARMGEFVELWRDPTKRTRPIWTAFEGLAQPTQEAFSAGFEFIGRRPDDRLGMKR
jgi:glycosyltransferase involved in cell wall biosynthesis/SAM-dependent methyltransferase